MSNPLTLPASRNRTFILGLLLSICLLSGVSGCVQPAPEIPPTCDDQIQNGDEEGVDCGGSACVPCPSCTDGIQNQGEEGIDCGGPCLLSCYTPPPCSPNTNQIAGSGAPSRNFPSVVTRVNLLDNFEVNGIASNAEIWIEFGTQTGPQANGNYTLDPIPNDLGYDRARIDVQIFDSFYNPHFVPASGTAFVEINATTISVIFCDLVFDCTNPSYPVSNYTWSGKIVYPK